MMTLNEALAAIQARLAEKPFANLDEILGEGWAMGISFRGHGPTYLARAIDRARAKAAAGERLGTTLESEGSAHN